MVTPHYVRWMTNWYPALLRVYEKQADLQGHKQVIGGGTFGRLLKRWGCLWCYVPRHVNTMHQANEFADVERSRAALFTESELIK